MTSRFNAWTPSWTRRGVLSLLVASGAACLAVAPGWAAEAVKIGSVLAITGPASFLGEPEEQTLKLYIDRINAEGGINGQMLELVVYDDGGDAGKAATFATRLVEEDNVVAVIGGSTTGSTMAMAPTFEDAGVPFISLAGAVVIVEPVKKYMFKTPHTDRMACEKIFVDMQARGLTKVGLISGTGGFGASMHEQCVAVAPDHGIEIIAQETYGPRDSDMTPQLTNLRNQPGIQAILNADFGQGPAIVTRNIQQLGIDLPVYQSHGVASKSFIDLAGDAAEGVRLPAAALLVADMLPDDDPQKPIALAYAEAYEEATGKPVSTFGGHAYDGLMILVEAMKRAGSADSDAIRDEIEKTTGLIGTAGTFNMTPEDHMGLDLTAFKMLEIRQGDWTLVD
jgi:branched-chain amino acid transport system substrate-binding protein